LRLVFLNKNNIKDNLFFLSMEDSKHIIINRMKIGDSMEAVLDNFIGKFIIKKILNKIVYGEFTKIGIIKNSSTSLDLMLGLPKDRALIPVIEKSAEIGINRIFIFPTKFSDKRELSENNIKRLYKIAKSGCEQSGNPIIPEIFFLNDLKTLFSKFNFNDNIKILLKEKNIDKNNFFDLINKIQIERFKNICIFVGPEGGISNDEANYLDDYGFIPLSLGNNILRTETAAISSLFFWKLFQNKYFND